MIIHSLPAPRQPRLPRCGDIGDNPREYEFEPLTEPATEPAQVPAQEPVTAPVEPEPVVEPEEVPV